MHNVANKRVSVFSPGRTHDLLVEPVNDVENKHVILNKWVCVHVSKIRRAAELVFMTMTPIEGVIP